MNGGGVLMKEKYYYIRDSKKRPIVTVCLIKDGDDISRGIAICSRRDSPRKTAGRGIARARAVYALESRSSCLLMKRLTVGVVHFACRCFADPYKSTLNPVLTQYEKRIFAERSGDG